MMINDVNIAIGITMARGRIISMFITTIYKIIVLIAIISSFCALNAVI